MKNKVLSKGQLQKTTTNSPPPMISGPSGGGKAANHPAPKPLQESGRVLLNEGPSHKSGAGKFTAPRKEPGHDPAECGYTRPGK